MRRWGDNEKRCGPFTFGRDKSYRTFALLLDSGEADYPGCCLRLSAFGCTLICELPAIIKPWRRWVDTSHYSWSTNPAGGYWDEHSQEYGIRLFEGHFNVMYGQQTGDSSTEKHWSCFLPWTQWRHVRRSLYDKSGREWISFSEKHRWPAEYEISKICPAVTFDFRDFDGELIQATTRIEEREWKFGTGWFKWLSLFRKNKIRRSLDIEFSAETGKKKGSWKGGTIGRGIDMIPAESHASAFWRYCLEHGMTFLGEAPSDPPTGMGGEWR